MAVVPHLQEISDKALILVIHTLHYHQLDFTRAMDSSLCRYLCCIHGSKVRVSAHE